MIQSEFPECTTFGTLMRFALELERVAALVNEELASDPSCAAGAETFKALAANHRARVALLEETRREKLNEAVLEPISDIRSADYVVATDVPKGAGVKDSAMFGAKVEETSARFYIDTARIAKSILHGAVRIFERMAKENLSNKAKLEAL
jgi:hypothetical protein